MNLVTLIIDGGTIVERVVYHQYYKIKACLLWYGTLLTQTFSFIDQRHGRNTIVQPPLAPLLLNRSN